MRSMENGAYTVENNANSRSFAFRELRTQGFQHGLNVAPGDIGPNWLGKDSLVNAVVFLSHDIVNGISE
jgi:hypothetical protein